MFSFWLVCFFLVGVHTQPRRYEYRPISGVGNNIDNPYWGSAHQPQKYVQMPSAFSDDISAPARADGPNPRWISNYLAGLIKNRPYSQLGVNQLHSYFGQLVVIDLSESAVGGEDFNISVPQDDPVYDNIYKYDAPTSIFSNFNFSLHEQEALNIQKYIYFQRNTPYPETGNSTSNPRLSINIPTSWLDMSFLYGSTPTPFTDPTTNATWPPYGIPTFTFDTDSLRDTNPDGTKSCKLLMNKTFNFYIRKTYNQGLFRSAGDYRMNISPPIYALHTLFLNEHNRLCDEYSSTSPTLDDDTLFEEARRTNIAQYQSIVTRPYLAASMGRPLSPYTALNGAISFNSSVEPSVDMFFTTVAFRYGHAAVLSNVDLVNQNGISDREGFLTRDVLFNPSTWAVSDDNMGPGGNGVGYTADILRGASAAIHAEVCPVFSGDLRNFLFVKPQHGLDLLAIDIQRARDCGVPDYNTARKYLGLSAVTNYSVITSNVNYHNALAEIYGLNNFTNIDPFIGALMEDHYPGSIVGPTARRSIIEQFTRLRNADRFWYENLDYFSQEEIEDIHGTTLSMIIQRNFPNVTDDSFPANPFFGEARQLNYVGADEIFFFPFDALKNVQLLSAAFQLSWDINDQIITIQLQAKTGGWMGIGFSPSELHTMKGADIVFCYWPSTPMCIDSYAIDVGAPTNDRTLSGTSDVTLLAANIDSTTGVRLYKFSRKINTGDVIADKPILPGGQNIIFAFHPTLNTLTYHGPTRASAIYLNFFRRFRKWLLSTLH